MERKGKFRYIVALATLYFVSTILLLVGYFTPQWVVDYSEVQNSQSSSTNIFITEECSTLGLVTGSCRYTYWNLAKSSGDMGNIMISVFWMMSSALITVAISFAMVTVNLVTNMLDNQVFVSFLSVFFGVLYPIAAILVLVSSTIVVAKYHDKIGYSAIISNIAGGLMLLFYIGLLVYDVMYSSSRVVKHEKKELINQNRNQE